ncbi:hypothetical protein SNE40_019853 [Patella caerulea]|uniref:Uncharacterized protein n=1 Tax=Patella caerulea TaxID=87958 RepID=A0AAN8IZ25_PATCE
MADAMLSGLALSGTGSSSPAESIASQRMKEAAKVSVCTNRKSADKTEITNSKKAENTSCKVVSAADIHVPPFFSKTSVSMASDKGASLTDVLSCLQSLMAEQSACNSRMDTLSAKVDDMYNYDYEADQHVYESEGEKNVEDNVQMDKDDNNNDPPYKKAKISR